MAIVPRKTQFLLERRRAKSKLGARCVRCGSRIHIGTVHFGGSLLTSITFPKERPKLLLKSTPNLDLAKSIAQKAHAGQADKAGVPYIEHPKFVAGLLETEDEKIVAYLHDVLEDTEITVEYLGSLFESRIVDAVLALTKEMNESYDDYLSRVKKNPLARAVKLKDLYHNMMLDRLQFPTDRDLKRVEKYKKAYEFLSI
jgi:(p)ppGpp synthase/HD superfamily hydrolase